MLGYTYDEFIGTRLWEIGPFKDIKECKLAFVELQEKEYIRYESLPLETKDGQSVAVEFVSNVYGVSGGTRVIQCNIRDITKRKQVEDALRQSEEEYRPFLPIESGGQLCIHARRQGSGVQFCFRGNVWIRFHRGGAETKPRLALSRPP